MAVDYNNPNIVTPTKFQKPGFLLDQDQAIAYRAQQNELMSPNNVSPYSIVRNPAESTMDYFGNPYYTNTPSGQEAYKQILTNQNAEMDKLAKYGKGGITTESGPNSPEIKVTNRMLPSNEWLAAIQSANENLKKVYGQGTGGSDASAVAPMVQFNPQYLPKTTTTAELNPGWNPSTYAAQKFGKNGLMGGTGVAGSVKQAPQIQAPKPVTQQSTTAYPTLAMSSLNQLRQNVESSNNYDAQKRDMMKYIPTSSSTSGVY
jgi:hypothetical protein